MCMCVCVCVCVCECVSVCLIGTVYADIVLFVVVDVNGTTPPAIQEDYYNSGK